MQGGKNDFAERYQCKPVLPRLSLAGKLEKPIMSLNGTKRRERGYGLRTQWRKEDAKRRYSMSACLKKLTSKGTWRQVFIWVIVGDKRKVIMSPPGEATSCAAAVRTGTTVRKWGWLVIEGECCRIWEICEVSSHQLHNMATALVFNLSSISCTSYCTLSVRHKGKC
jgi:hypothetical protein